MWAHMTRYGMHACFPAKRQAGWLAGKLCVWRSARRTLAAGHMNGMEYFRARERERLFVATTNNGIGLDGS